MYVSVQFSHSVMFESLQPHESQHARPPCPSPTTRVHSDSCPSSQWYHPAVSSSVVPFSSCPQSLPASKSSSESTLRMNWPNYWSSDVCSSDLHIEKQRHYFVNKGPCSQGYGFSSSHVWMWELDYKDSWALKNWRFWTVVLDLLAVQGTLKSLLQHHSSKASILRCSAFLTVQLSHHIWPLEKS